jgi:hypothetical protein
MATADVNNQHFTYESRLASFQSAGLGTEWPHTFLSAVEVCESNLHSTETLLIQIQLAQAGFFYSPSPLSLDIVTCYLCEICLDGWKDGDDPIVEHLVHSLDCGWAIVVNKDLRQEYSASGNMIRARKATFAGKWPHEEKEGNIKVNQVGASFQDNTKPLLM